MLRNELNIWDIFANRANDNVTGPFEAIYDYLDANSLEIPLWLSSYDRQLLDLTFIEDYAAGKNVRRAIRNELKTAANLPDPDTYPELYCVTQSIVDKWALYCFHHFFEKWEADFTVLHDEYNPLENYSMSETRTPDLTDTTTVDTKVTTTGKNKVYGFNSSTAVPATEQEAETNGTAANNRNVLKRTGTEKLARSGNIGVTTSQQMLISELELRRDNVFQSILFADMASYFCSEGYTFGQLDFNILN